MVDTRKSRSLIFPSFRYLIMIRPSCGNRFSLISSLAMILIRLVMASRSFKGGVITACRIPSIRRRTRTSFSYGSILMSLAAPFQVGEIRFLFFRGQLQVRGFLGAQVLHHLFELVSALD